MTCRDTTYDIAMEVPTSNMKFGCHNMCLSRNTIRFVCLPTVLTFPLGFGFASSSLCGRGLGTRFCPKDPGVSTADSVLGIFSAGVWHWEAGSKRCSPLWVTILLRNPTPGPHVASEMVTLDWRQITYSLYYLVQIGSRCRLWIRDRHGSRCNLAKCYDKMLYYNNALYTIEKSGLCQQKVAERSPSSGL